MPVRGTRTALAAVIAAVALALVAGACSQSVKCSMVPPDAVFTGVVHAKRGALVDFVVETVERHDTSNPSHQAPRVSVGDTVRVRYEAGTAQFLHVGERYDVRAIWLDGHFNSDVHTADRPCSGATTRADGRPIDTSLWHRAAVRRVAYVGTALVAVIAIVAFAISRGRRRRRQRIEPSAQEVAAAQGLDRLRRR